MQQRHKDHNQYFNEQAECMRRFVIPYIEQQRAVTADMCVLQIPYLSDFYTTAMYYLISL